MLTNTGKNILAKYLIGQAPAYASFIAFGSGATPLGTSDAFGDYSTKESLDFEMFRAPIISRGYVADVEQATITNVTANGNAIAYTANNTFQIGDTVTITGTNVLAFNITDAVIASVSSTGFTVNSTATGTYSSGGLATRTVSSIVFTAQLPTEERYEITELGIFSAGANPTAGPTDSKVLYSFSNTENWEYHLNTGSATVIPFYPDSLDKINGVIPDGLVAGDINVSDKVFEANADNPVLNIPAKVGRSERTRFLNNTLFMRGDASAVTGTGSSLSINPSNSTHIHLAGTSVDLDRNSGQDEISLAFALVNKDGGAGAQNNPSDVKIILEFSNEEGAESPQSARMKLHLTSTGDNFNSNRYFVKRQKLEDLEKTGGFVWSSVRIVKIYVSILEGSSYSDDFYVALDAIRLENLTADNPLYGLTAYTVVKNEAGIPIIKDANSNNLMEFRFAMEVK
jgi:hypothetical protein